MQGFIFGGGDTPWTYEQLQQRRKVAESLASKASTAPRNVGEGLTAIGNALLYRSLNKKADARDAELKGEFESQWGRVFGGMGGGAPDALATGVVTPRISSRPLDPNAPESIAGDTMATLLKTGLVDRGLPEHVADGFVMNARDESGLKTDINEANPLVPGSRGGYGLWQWTGPRRRALEAYAQSKGVPVSDLGLQLDFLVSELQGPEAAAAGEILSTKDAGGAASAIVNRFLRPAEEHRARRAAEYGGQQPAGGADMMTLANLAGNPYASPAQKAIVSALMERQLQQSDPMYAMGLEKAQLELEALRNPQPDLTSGQREYEMARAQGYQGSFMDYKRDLAESQRAQTNVNVNTGSDSSALTKKLSEKEGELWSTYLDQGGISSGTMQDMQMLDEIITMAPQGPVAGRLAQMFPGVSSAADAFQSIVKRVAPTLRAPGSGATSDIEYDGMLKSLPQLSSQPEANTAIAAMMKAKAQINIERANVVRSFQNGEISEAQARATIQEIDQRSIMTPELRGVLGGLGPADDTSADDDLFTKYGIAR